MNFSFDVKSTSQDHRLMQKQTNDKQQQPKNEKDYMLVKQKAKQNPAEKTYKYVWMGIKA